MKNILLALILLICSGCTVYVHREPYPSYGYGGYGGGYGGYGGYSRYYYPGNFYVRPYSFRTFHNFYGSWGWGGSSWRGGRRHHHHHHHK